MPLTPIRSSLTRLRRVWLSCAWLGAAALLTACGGGGSNPSATTPPVVVGPPTATPTVPPIGAIERPLSDEPVGTDQLKTAKFSGANSCGALEKYIEDTVTQQMRARLESDRDKPFGYRIGVPGVNFVGTPVASPAPGVGASVESRAPAAVSDTNVRTSGVDEPDVMKNDGTRMFVISGQSVLHLSSWPAAQLKITARTEFTDTRPSGLLMLDSRLIVLSQKYAASAIIPNPLGVPTTLAALPVFCVDCRYPSQGSTRITVLDVSTPSAPKMLREFDVAGNMLNARLINQSLRMASSVDHKYPAGLQWYPVPAANPNRTTPTGIVQPWEPFASAQERIAAYNAIMDSNEVIIRAQALAAWTPAGVDCSQVMAPNATSAFGWVALNSIDLSAPTAAQSVSQQHILTEPGLIYTSAQHMHIVSRHWYRRTAAAQTDTSYVHRLAFSSATGFELRASGTVEGTLKDEFSIDEAANGDLRMALGVTRYGQDSTGRLTRTQTSNISVLRATADKLQVIGKTPPLAPGETIQSARFMGDRGFLVTFRQVDPLFAIDLSNPSAPTVMGELKVPGFSSYLHPVDANTLLGIGTFLPEPDANGRIDGSQRRVQVSLFDVSNMRAPRQIQQLSLGSVSSSSAAQFEHKAFNYLSAKKRLAVPFMDHGIATGGPTLPPTSSIAPGGGAPYFSARSSLKVIDVDPVKGFTLRGDLSQAAEIRTLTTSQARLVGTPWITRSVLADDIVYAVSEIAVNAADVSNLASPVAMVKLSK